MNRTHPPSSCTGLTLLELLLAMSLTAILLLGLVQLVSAAGSAARLQDNQATLQDRARYATNLLSSTISEAGFSPEPWTTEFDSIAISPETEDGVSPHSDRLVVSTWSDRNCFGNINPDRDADGRPRFFLRKSAFDLNGSGHLARSCRYGPSAGRLTTQVRRQGLVPGVESFQCLFGLDSDHDGNVDKWVRAGHWPDETQIIGVRAALLLASPDAVASETGRTWPILDSDRRPRADGKLRELVELTLAIRSRGG